jgi:hypothetical protein
MRQETRFKFNAYLSRVAELNGIDAGDVSKKFTVEPSVTQTLMNTMQESSDFLTRINIVPVSEMKGEKIGIGVTGSLHRQHHRHRRWHRASAEGLLEAGVQ